MLKHRHLIHGLVAMAFIATTPAWAEPHHGHDHSEDEDDAQHREMAAKRVEWRAEAGGDTLRVKLLGINDFHGQLSAGRRVSNRPAAS